MKMSMQHTYFYLFLKTRKKAAIFGPKHHKNTANQEIGMQISMQHTYLCYAADCMKNDACTGSILPDD